MQYFGTDLFPLSYAWVDGANSRVESATVWTSPFASHQVQATFKVSAPNVKAFAQVYNNATKGGTIGPSAIARLNSIRRVLTFGDLTSTPSTPGMAYYGSIQTGWNLAFAQVIQVNGDNYTSFGRTYDPPLPRVGLDSHFPYPTSTELIGGQMMMRYSNDSPGLPINKGGTTHKLNSFTTWYMAQPVAGGTPIGYWVPIASLTWTVDLTATWASTAVDPVIDLNRSKDPKISHFNPAPAGQYFFAPTALFPEWGGIVDYTKPFTAR